MAVVWRHRNKLMFAAVLAGGGYVGIRFLWKKMKELQEKEAIARLESVRFRDHFQRNCSTALSAVKEVLPSLMDAIQRELDSETLTQTLRGKPANKHSLWEELKVISFARFVGSVYAYALLLVFMRIQLAILGGIMLRWVTKGQTVVKDEDNQKQKEYLATVQYLLKDGLHSLLESVRQASEQVLSSYSLKQPLTNEAVLQLIRDICQHTPTISHSPRSPSSSLSPLGQRRQSHFLLKHTMPTEALLQQTSSETGRSSCNDVTTERRKEDGGKFGRELMMATRDVVESEDLVEVLEECVEAILTHSTGLLMGSLSSASCQKSSSELAMAAIIPVVCDTSLCIFQPQSHTSAPLQDLLGSKAVVGISKNIYEAFSTELS